MDGKTLVLRKDRHWYVINSRDGDEREILLTLLAYSEDGVHGIERGEVLEVMSQLGWELEVYDNTQVA